MTDQSMTIPKGWKTTTLGEIKDKLFSGGTPNTSIREYWGGELNWLSSGETGQRFIQDTKKKITQMGVDKSSTRLADKNFVVIATAGQGNTRGQVSLLKVQTYINQSVIAVDCKKNFADNIWLFYNLSNRYFELRFISESNSVRGSLTTDILNSIKVLLPPLSEQRAIASVLSSFDDKIELLREENKTLEAIAQTIFKEWSRNFKAKDFIKAQEILEFEKGIEVGSSNYLKNKNNLKKPEMFYRVGDIINNGNISSVYCERDLLKDKLFKNDDVLVSFDGTVGRVFIGGVGGYSSGIIKIFDKNKNIKNSFLYFWAKSRQVQKIINLYSEGTTIQHAGKSIPYLEITSNQRKIDKITETLNPIFLKILENLSQIQILSSLRDVLLPKLMKGEIRVKNEKLKTKNYKLKVKNEKRKTKNEKLKVKN